MEIFIANQFKTILESWLLGLIFGAGYDIIRIAYILCHVAVYRGKRAKPVPHTKGAFAVFFILDFLYLLVVTFFFSVFLYHANHGQFRLYLFLLAVLGFSLYYNTVGRIVMFFSETIVSFLRRTISILVWKPLVFFFHMLRRLCRCVWCRTGAVLAGKWRVRRRKRYALRLEKKFADWVRL